jgi:hypothetical protein
MRHKEIAKNLRGFEPTNEGSRGISDSHFTTPFQASLLYFESLLARSVQNFNVGSCNKSENWIRHFVKFDPGTYLGTGLPDGLFSNQKSQFGENFHGLWLKTLIHIISGWNVLQIYGIFYDHLVNFVFIWCIFSCLGIMHQEKSGRHCFDSSVAWLGHVFCYWGWPLFHLTQDFNPGVAALIEEKFNLRFERKMIWKQFHLIMNLFFFPW